MAKNENGVTVEVAEEIAVVTMDRPPVNAMSSGLRRDLTVLFAELDERDDVKVIILTGAQQIFCGGMDVKELRAAVRQPGDKVRDVHEHRSFTNGVRECSKPVIAAINGAAVGTGVNIAAACDILLASDNAWMGMPEVSLGMPNGATGLVRLFGQSRGRRMFLSGHRVSAQELYRLGVIEACVPREQLMDAAMEIAREIARQDLDALIAAKHIYNLAQEVPFAIAKNSEYALTAMLGRARAGKVASSGAARKAEGKQS